MVHVLVVPSRTVFDVIKENFIAGLCQIQEFRNLGIVAEPATYGPVLYVKRPQIPFPFRSAII